MSRITRRRGAAVAASVMALAVALIAVGALPADGQTSTTVEIDVAGVVGGDTNVDLIVNGVVEVIDHQVVAVRHQGVDTVSATVGGDVDTVEVRFDNDSSTNNLFLYDVRIDGVAADLTDGFVLRAGWTESQPVTDGSEVALWWNASYHLDPGGPIPGDGRANLWRPSDTTFNWGGGDTLDAVRSLLDQRTRTVEFDAAGVAVDDTPSNAIVITVPAGLADPVGHIEQEFAARGLSMTSNTGGHVVVDLAAGEHRFTRKLSFRRGDVTLRGAGSDGTNPTVIVHDFADVTAIDHAIEFRSPELVGDRIGFAENEVLPDADLLPGISLRDFAMTYALDEAVDIDDDDVPGGMATNDLREVASQNFVPKYAAPNPARQNPGDTQWQRQAAISLDGVLEADVVGIRASMVGSHFLGIHESRGVYADALVADGTLNRGGGGNGYALELIQSHDCVIRFDAVIDFRHVSINNDDSTDAELNWSTGNVIAVEYSNTNLDVHKQTERDNVLYAEMTVASPYISALNYGADGEPGGWTSPWYWSSELASRRDSWGLFEVRRATAAAANNWYGDIQIAAGSLNAGGEPVGTHDPQITNLYYSLFKDDLRASTNDGVIYGGYHDDVLTGGDGHNVFVFAADPGHDVVKDFAPDDTISIQTGTDGITTPADVTSRTSVDGADVVITLGTKSSVLIEGAAGFFDVATHVEIGDHVFYDAQNRDFAYMANHPG